MKHYMKTRMLCMLLLMVCACMNAEAKPQDTVRRGMTKDEVRMILGKPDDTSFDRYSEQWEYYKNRGPLKYDKIYYVVFDDQERVSHYRSVTVRPENKDACQEGNNNIIIPIESRPGHIRCMDKPSFDLLMKKIQQASFTNNKLDIIEVACLGFYFSSNQCARIMRTISFDDDRLKALKLMANRIVDTHDTTEIYKALSFSSNKEKAMKILQAR